MPARVSGRSGSAWHTRAPLLAMQQPPLLCKRGGRGSTEIHYQHRKQQHKNCVRQHRERHWELQQQPNKMGSGLPIYSQHREVVNRCQSGGMQWHWPGLGYVCGNKVIHKETDVR